jgi:hypothetical protein
MLIWLGRYRAIGSDNGNERSNWWVIGGSTPMNLYSMKIFPEADVAYSLHHGLMLRMADRNYRASKTAPETSGTTRLFLMRVKIRKKWSNRWPMLSSA